MALKGDLLIGRSDYDVAHYILAITGPSTTRMDRGGVVCATTGIGSGSTMDTAQLSCEYVTNPSGRQVVGVLLNDVVSIDLSRQILNPYKDENQIGNKATLMTRGEIVTNMLDPTAATGTTFPNTAYCGPSGLFTGTNPGGYPVVGRFLTKKDSDGYARVQFDALSNL